MNHPRAVQTTSGAVDTTGDSYDPRKLTTTHSISAPTVPDYELLRRVGAGAYGEIWLARNTATKMWRAVKIVWRDKFQEERPFQREFEGIQRFERISRQHPSQLSMFHIGRNEAAGYFYYVMELADPAPRPKSEIRNPQESIKQPTTGNGLAAFALELPSDLGIRNSDLYTPHTLRTELANGRLPAARVLEIGLALTEALGHLHSHGLVHRDVKPSNVIFVNGRPKLADIGLVTGVGDGLSIVGTEGYLPPEGPGSRQADIFALGKVLFEAATGLSWTKFPQLPPDLRAWPDARLILELNEVLLKACAADPRQRYETAERMSADLAILKSGQSIKHLRTVERRLALLTKAGVGVGIAAFIATGIFYETNNQRRKALRNLVRLHVTNGKRSLDDSDLFGSLLSFTEALHLDPRNAKREECHQIRIASVLGECPKLVGLFGYTNAPINHAAFSPDSLRLVTANDDKTAQVWDVVTGKRLFTLAHSNLVFSAYFSPDGQVIATSSSDNLIHLWNAQTGKELLGPRIRHKTKYMGPHPRFSPDGRHLITVNDDYTLCLWNLASGQPVGEFLRHHAAVSFFLFSPDSRYLLTLTGDSQARLWDTSSGKLIHSFMHDAPVNCGTFSPDGRTLATGGDDDCVRLWDLSSRHLIGQPLTHRDSVTSVEFSPEGGRLAVACRDRTVELWDIVAHRPILRPLLHDQKVFRVGFSPDGRWLVTSSRGNRVRLWDSDNGRIVAPPLTHFTPFGPVVFSPDGHLVLTVRRDLTLEREEIAVIWSLARVEKALLPMRPAVSFRKKAHSADRRFTAILSGNRVYLEDNSGTAVTQPLAQSVPFRQAYFSRNDDVLVTESADGLGQLWDPSAGEPLTPPLRTRQDGKARAPSKHELRKELPAASRQKSELMLLAQLLSGNRVDETGGFRPIDTTTLINVWNKLRRSYPEALSTSDEEVAQWHDQQAMACEQTWNWWSARFHLKEFLKSRPGDSAVEARLAYAQRALDSANQHASGYLERRRVIPPRNPLAGPGMIDLTSCYQGSRTAGKYSLEALPSGLQTFGGTQFDIRGVVQLSGQVQNDDAKSLPERTGAIPVKQKFSRLHFLHVAASEVANGREVASYVLHYNDGRTTQIPVVYGQDVANCWIGPEENLASIRPVPAWVGTDLETKSDEARWLRVFKTDCKNPWPDLEIVSLEFVSSLSGTEPLLIAITGD